MGCCLTHEIIPFVASIKKEQGPVREAGVVSERRILMVDTNKKC